MEGLQQWFSLLQAGFVSCFRSHLGKLMFQMEELVKISQCLFGKGTFDQLILAQAFGDLHKLSFAVGHATDEGHIRYFFVPCISIGLKVISIPVKKPDRVLS